METVLKLGVDSSPVNRARTDLDALTAAGKRAEDSATGLGGAFASLKGVIAGAISAAAVKQVVEMADSMTLLSAKLSLVVSGTAALARVQSDLFNVSQRTRTGFKETADLFGSLARSTERLGVSQRDVVSVTETINKAIQISGASAASASAALIQLGQGFASGTLRGEELNSVLEQTPRLARAIADGLGVSVGQLRQLGQEGKLTADAVFGALQKAGASINDEFAKLPLTVGGALTQAQNAFLQFVDVVNNSTGATGGLAGAISGAASALVEFNAELKRAGQGAEDVGLLATVFQAALDTIQILGANLSFVLKGVGREIGAIAAQAAALARLDIAGFKAISEAVKRDAEEARKALDEFERRVLDTGKRLQAELAKQQRIEDRGFVPTPAARPPSASTGGAAKISEADRYAESLRTQLQTLRELSAVEKLLEDIQVGRLGKITQKDRERLQALADQVDAQKRLKSQLEAEKKQVEDLNKARQEELDLELRRRASDEARQAAIEAIGTAQVQLAQQTISDLEFETKALQLSNRERAVAINLRRLEAQGIIQGSAAYAVYAERVREATEKLFDQQAFEAQQKAIQREWEKTADQIGQSLTDQLIEGGRSAWEYITNLFRATVLRPVVQAITQPIAGAAASLLTGGTAAASTGSTLSQAGGLTGSLQTSILRLGDYLATSQSSFANSIGEFLQSNSGGLGVAGSALAGYGIGRIAGSAISGGFGLGGGSGNSAINLGAAIGTAIAPGIGTAIGAALGGVANRLFGRRLEDSGIQGTLGGAAGFSGNAFEFLKGGLFRSDKTVTDAIDPALAAALQTGVNTIKQSVSKYADALGLGSEAIAGFEQEIRLSLKGLSEQEIQQKLQDTLKAFSDGLVATLAPSLEPFKRAGETTEQTLQRLGDSLTGVNAVLAQFGRAALDVSVAGADAASQLADLFGGAANFAQSAAGFYTKFYTEAERADQATQQITQALAAVGLQLPETREQFRALVESAANAVDTAAGREQLAALLKVSDAFDFVRQTADAAAEAADELAQAQARAARALADAIDQAQLAFLSPEQRPRAQANTLRRQLQDVGLDFSIDQLLGATKQEIYDFARAFVEAGENSDAAKLAVVQVAAALADLKDSAAQAAFDIAASGIQKQLDEIAQTFGDVSVIAEPVKTLADKFREQTASLEDLENGLASLLGTVGKTVQQTLADLLQSQAAIQGFRGTLADAIEQAQLSALSPDARVAALRQQEQALSGQIATSADPVGVAQRLQKVILQRIQEEAGIRQKADDARIDAARQQLDLAEQARNAQIDLLRDQIDGFEALRELSRDIGRTVSQLKSGDLSPLSPQRQLAEARKLFESTAAGAAAGNPEDARAFEGALRDFISEGRDFFGGSTPQFASLFAGAIATADKLGLAGAAVDPQIAALESQITQLQALNEAQNRIESSVINTGAEQAEALRAIDEALASREEAMAKAIAEQTQLAKDQITELRAAVEALRAQITQGAATEASLRAQLEELNDKLQQQLDNASLEAAAP